ncbi:MAG TPA: glycoside hydrolase family 38 C-terminal domain-containing protein, partial [Roseiflexaceae bacterium]|nr:glycoside hydrolase family 38 C-terminal domain-containing protein [Roseiflexaceae bacterium]
MSDDFPQPQIREVLLLHHSHTDIGYTNHQETVFANQRAYLRRALELAERYADGAPGEQFKWTCETTILAEDFLRHATSAEVERLQALHRRGLIDFGGMYCNVTPLFTADMLARTLEVAGALRRDYGLEVRYALNCDVNGQSWGLVELLLDAGFEGIAMAINRVMARDPQPRPAAFRWQGPSGRSILAWHGEHYGYGHYCGIPRARVGGRWVYDPALAREQLAAYMDGLAQKRYPFDFLYFQITSTFMWDNGGPHEELVRFVREWNARGWQPRMRLVGLAELFARLAAQPEAALPLASGEWTDWWSHGVASSAYETALARRAHGRLFAAAGLAALLRGLPGAPLYPQEEDRAAWRGLALYDEHTWGGFDSITFPDSANARGQWHRKAGYAYEGTAAATRLAQRALNDLAARLPQPEGLHALVYNPLPWPRRAPLLLPRLTPTGWEQADLERRLELCDPHGPHPPVVDYGVVDLPACGYAAVLLAVEAPDPQELVVGSDTVRIHAPQPPQLVPRPPRGQDPATAVRHHGWTLANRFYRLALDPASGAVRSLVDAASGHEWVDASTPWRLGHYIYETNRSPRGRGDMQLQYTYPAVPDYDRQADLAPERAGPSRVRSVAFVPGLGSGRLALQLEAPGAAELHLQVVLYDELPWIDLVYDLKKLPVTDPESVYIAFPLSLDAPAAHYEAAGAIVRAEEQQIAIACRDFYAVQNWVDISDPQRGMTVALPDAPIVHFGGFTNHR